MYFQLHNIIPSNIRCLIATLLSFIVKKVTDFKHILPHSYIVCGRKILLHYDWPQPCINYNFNLQYLEYKALFNPIGFNKQDGIYNPQKYLLSNLHACFILPDGDWIFELGLLGINDICVFSFSLNSVIPPISVFFL